MKIIGTIVSVCSLALPAMAASYDVSCGVTKQKTQGDYKVSASLKGTVSGNADEGFTLEDYKLSYTVYSSDDSGDSHWTDETIRGNQVENNPDYNPREYKNHVQFKLPSKRGKVELIYPAKLGSVTKFKAHVVMTWIDDHFGGTAHMFCKRTRN